MTRVSESWTLPAPNSAPAWYDYRHCMIFTTRKKRDSIFEALSKRDLNSVEHGAELLHELVHLVQDCSTGWGFYQSELLMALTVSRAALLAGVINKTGCRDAPIEQTLNLRSHAICPHEYETCKRFMSIWTHFRERRADGLSELDLIESHAFAYQVIQHLYAGQTKYCEELMQKAASEYWRALNGTIAALKLKMTSLADTLVVLSVHQVFCELSFSCPPSPRKRSYQPVGMQPDDFEGIMPESLSQRFMRILAEAMNAPAPDLERIVRNDRVDIDAIERCIRYYMNHEAWLRNVEVASGEDLESRWMSVFRSPGEISGAGCDQSADPIRAFRAWSMRHWRPFSDVERNQLIKLMAYTPGFRISDGETHRWHFEIEPGRSWISPERQFNLQELQDFFGAVGGDLNGGAVMSELPQYFLTGVDHYVPCPYAEGCPAFNRDCNQSVAKGIRPSCHADNVPERTIGLRIRTIRENKSYRR